MAHQQTWGESLFLVVRRSGGLPQLLERLAPAIEESPPYQSPTGYNDLYRLIDAPEPNTTAYVRAWLLVLVGGTKADMNHLGLSDDGLMPILHAKHIRRLLNVD